MKTQQPIINQSHHPTFYVADWRIEPDTLRMFHKEKEVKLEPKVMQVLIYLACKPGEVITREELEATIWAGRVVGYDALANTIIKLRKAFGDNSRNPGIIKTIPKTGYMLIAKVKQSKSDSEITYTQNSDKVQTNGKLLFKYKLQISLVAAIILIITLGTWDFTTKPSSIRDQNSEFITASKPSIAVLPLINVGANPIQEYFSDGITEDLITDLSKIQGLNVVARNSAFAYKDSTKNEQLIGHELKTHYILKGSVQRSGQQIRMNVQLINVADGRNLWAERYVREIGEIFQLQDELTGQIVSAMKVELAPVDQQRLSQKYIASIEAYDEFLKGLEYHGRRSPGDSLLAKIHFRKAIELDPKFARAYASLALTYTREAIDGWGSSAHDSLNQASALVQKAIEIDNSIHQLYFVTSLFKLSKKDFSGAINDIEEAIRINPNYADGYALLGWVLHFAGRSDEGKKVMQRAIQLNPRIPAIYRLVLGAIYYAQEDLDKAIEMLQIAADINPKFQQVRVWLTAVYSASGQMDEAHWQVLELLMINPDFSLQSVNQAFPFRDPVYRDRFIADLVKAGLSY